MKENRSSPPIFLTPEHRTGLLPADPLSSNAIDAGEGLAVAMPQSRPHRWWTRSSGKCSTPILQRLDEPKSERADANLLILWAGAAQQLHDHQRRRNDDYNAIDVIREAPPPSLPPRSPTSSFAPLGHKARVHPEYAIASSESGGRRSRKRRLPRSKFRGDVGASTW